MIEIELLDNFLFLYIFDSRFLNRNNYTRLKHYSCVGNKIIIYNSN